MPNASEGEVNKECVPSGPVIHGSVSGLPAGATGNNETTSGIPAGDAAEKGGATDTLETPRVSGESASEYRARVISVGDVGGDSSASSANPSFYTEILLLPEERTIKISPTVAIHAAGERGSLQVGEEILVTLVTGTNEVNRIVRRQCESSGQG